MAHPVFGPFNVRTVVTLDRPVISEGDGPNAAVATITRTPVTTGSLDVDLESTDTSELTLPARVTIPPDIASVEVPVESMEDEVVDGDQVVVVRVYPLAENSEVRLQEGTPAQITVTDNDVPTLYLTVEQSLVAEDLDPATTATVTRNTPVDAALPVQLASSDPSEVMVPTDVTIPAGQVSVTFPVATVNDQQPDGEQSVTLTARAPGYLEGEATLTVTDIDLPDLVISQIMAPTFVDAEAWFPIGYRVENQGRSMAGTNWLTRVFLSRDEVVGDDTLVGQFTFSGSIPEGDYFEQTLQARAPLSVGSYWVVIVTDAADEVSESLETNNVTVSTTPIEVVAAYDAVVETPVEVAPAGTVIPLQGWAFASSGGPAQNQLVNIHILVRGTRRVISALTDEDGDFSTTWTPLANEAGSYGISCGTSWLGGSAGAGCLHTPRHEGGSGGAAAGSGGRFAAHVNSRTAQPRRSAAFRIDGGSARETS
ncbi:MAG: hypothetical protein H7A46_09910 [Verrucomicrobiales bacterium]|nr:hypothetical protein [Verrucomicrobiales bacterium]